MAPPVDLARTGSLDDEVRASEYGTDLEAALLASAQVSAADYPGSEDCALELALRRSRQESGVYFDDAAAFQAVIRQSRYEARVRWWVAGHPASPVSCPPAWLRQEPWLPCDGSAAGPVTPAGAASGPLTPAGAASSREHAVLAAGPATFGVAPGPVVPDFEPLSPPESGPESGDEYDSE